MNTFKIIHFVNKPIAVFRKHILKLGHDYTGYGLLEHTVYYRGHIHF